MIAMSDMSGNLVEGPNIYDPYGRCTIVGGAGCTTQAQTTVPFRFTGQRLEWDNGLYYYRARFYFPTIGRFLQTDPVGPKDDLNLYAYVGNDPTGGTDPTGLLTVTAQADAGGDIGTIATYLFDKATGRQFPATGGKRPVVLPYRFRFLIAPNGTSGSSELRRPMGYAVVGRAIQKLLLFRAHGGEEPSESRQVLLAIFADKVSARPFPSPWEKSFRQQS